ncbi:MAG TPA: dTDP-4-dehydrorhamnose 3,5-epimerase [Thermoanaerobaculia bacterium]|jgi:dTDP-4-dehydrorhamnose 3,5-epimerase
MIFHEVAIPGAYLLEPERKEDHRGFFARTYCRRELEDRSLDPTVVQCSISVNKARGTVRGMHWQAEPYPEVRLVRCTRGAVHDVILDLRPGSPAFKKHYAVELDDENRLSLYVPAGCAHGFQTLTDGAEVFYQMSEFYYAELACGVRWNDPAFDVTWPLEISVISEKDLSFPDFDEKRTT